MTVHKLIKIVNKIQQTVESTYLQQTVERRQQTEDRRQQTVDSRQQKSTEKVEKWKSKHVEKQKNEKGER